MKDIQCTCPKCGDSLEAPRELGGKQVECPSCGQRLTVPDIWGTSSGDRSIPEPSGPPPVYARETCQMAVWSLVLGIFGIRSGWSCCGLAVPIAAVVLGHIALSSIKRQPETLQGSGLAVAGLVTGYVGLVISIILGLVLGVLGAIAETL